MSIVERLREDCNPRTGDDWPDFHGRVKPAMLEAAAIIEELVEALRLIEQLERIPHPVKRAVQDALTKDRDALLELAERCEKATGPDRDLDYDIHTIALGKAPNLYGFQLPWFTRSLDAALTLAPERKHFGVGDCDDTKRAWAWCGRMSGMLAIEEELGSAATPALALCAASLRAHAAMMEDNNG